MDGTSLIPVKQREVDSSFKLEASITDGIRLELCEGLFNVF